MDMQGFLPNLGWKGLVSCLVDEGNGEGLLCPG